MKAWINGKFINEEEAAVPVLSHSFGRGTAIFEVVDIVEAQNGPAYFGLVEHVNRFFNSAAIMHLNLPYTKEELIDACRRTAKINGVREGIAKFFAYLPGVELGVMPHSFETSTAIFCIDLATIGATQEQLSAPVTAGISEIRKTHPETVPPQVKVAGNYVNAYLARMDAKRKGYDDVIMLDAMGFVAEAATSNTFFIKDGTVLTPPLGNILPGITRMAAMEVLKDIGRNVLEKRLKPDDVFRCDEAFYTTSFLKIQPIISINGISLKDGAPGPVTSSLIDQMSEVYKGGLEKYGKWLTYID